MLRGTFLIILTSVILSPIVARAADLGLRSHPAAICNFSDLSTLYSRVSETKRMSHQGSAANLLLADTKSTRATIVPNGVADIAPPYQAQHKLPWPLEQTPDSLDSLVVDGQTFERLAGHVGPDYPKPALVSLTADALVGEWVGNTAKNRFLIQLKPDGKLWLFNMKPALAPPNYYDPIMLEWSLATTSGQTRLSFINRQFQPYQREDMVITQFDGTMATTVAERTGTTTTMRRSPRYDCLARIQQMDRIWQVNSDAPVLFPNLAAENYELVTYVLANKFAIKRVVNELEKKLIGHSVDIVKEKLATEVAIAILCVGGGLVATVLASPSVVGAPVAGLATMAACEEYFRVVNEVHGKFEDVAKLIEDIKLALDSVKYINRANSEKMAEAIAHAYTYFGPMNELLQKLADQYDADVDFLQKNKCGLYDSNSTPYFPYIDNDGERMKSLFGSVPAMSYMSGARPFRKSDLAPLPGP